MHHKIIKFALMTTEQMYNHFTNRLETIYNPREAANIADWVFESAAKIKRLHRITEKQEILNEVTTRELNDKLQQLLLNKPVQYVLEEAWFYKMKFFVNNHVLIPRPETEELVEWLTQETKDQNQEIKILDIGTGSGCIAIALKKNLPAADIFAVDISEQALLVARQNALQLNANINFLLLDFLNEDNWHQLPSFEIIISNPPYIPEKEKTAINSNVIDYEPHQALFVEHSDMLIFYKKIALFAQSHLNKSGKVYVEVHEGYAADVQEIFIQHHFKSGIRKDIYGRDRMVSAHR